ncbi:unnamed protein product [Parnassius apollo]|uniref:(apollo) hypothetical protein n=1 Tax=Parnassius apollo TaxID=110799 RepID=A0A8S3Y8R4_PARAO|nr:unnamed protein product [Parnassius apollo]
MWAARAETTNRTGQNYEPYGSKLRAVRVNLVGQTGQSGGPYGPISQTATSSAEMRTLESLLGWEANDPEDNIVLKRIIKLIDSHLPLGWKEWKIRVLDKEDLLGNEFDPQILNKIRFAIPTVGLARAFSPECISLKEKTYRDIKLKLLKWPLCVGLIIHPMSLAARVRGSAVQNELIIASISDMRPLLKSREEANRELAAQSEQSEDEISVPSTRSSSSRSKKPSRLDKLEQGQRKLENMLEQFIKSFQPEDHSYSGSEKVSTSPEPSEDEENAPQLSVSSPKPCEPSTSLVNEDFDWTPTTRQQEPLIPTPSQHIATQGIECQRLGDISFCQIRYAEVQKKLHASPVFGPLKVNPILTTYGPPSNQDQLVRMDYTLGTISHGLLLQREALTNTLKDLAIKHPAMKQDLKNILSTDTSFKSLSNDLLQYVCGRRAEIIEQRRNGFLPKEEYQAALLRAIPPVNHPSFFAKHD